MERRALLRDLRFWGAAGLAAVGLLPVLGWNAAHGWASFHWQISHAANISPGATAQNGLLWRWLGNVQHAVAYHTWPLAILALAGAFGLIRHRSNAAARLCLWLALLVGLPPLLSPAGSPRNLTGGLIFLLLGAGFWVEKMHHWRKALLGGNVLLLGLTALYGGGTVVAKSPFHSSAVNDARRETADLPAIVAHIKAHPEMELFALDMSLAGQLWYYTGRPVATGWPQYQLWELPYPDPLAVFSLGYLPAARVESQLRAAYTLVEGPYTVEGTTRACVWWRAEGLREAPEKIPARLDFFTLWEGEP